MGKGLTSRKGLKTKASLTSSVGLSTKSPLSKEPHSSLKRKAPAKGTPASQLLKRAKPKEKSISQLKKLADKYHSLATRYRFAELVNGEYVASCLTCGAVKPVKQLQCGHFMGRAHNAVRFAEENTAPQCYGCNVMQQGRQFIFGMEIDKLYGDGTAQRLYKESREPYQFKREELLEIISEAKEQVKYYETQLSS